MLDVGRTVLEVVVVGGKRSRSEAKLEMGLILQDLGQRWKRESLRRKAASSEGTGEVVARERK